MRKRSESSVILEFWGLSSWKEVTINLDKDAGQSGLGKEIKSSVLVMLNLVISNLHLDAIG